MNAASLPDAPGRSAAPDAAAGSASRGAPARCRGIAPAASPAGRHARTLIRADARSRVPAGRCARTPVRAGRRARARGGGRNSRQVDAGRHADGGRRGRNGAALQRDDQGVVRSRWRGRQGGDGLRRRRGQPGDAYLCLRTGLGSLYPTGVGRRGAGRGYRHPGGFIAHGTTPGRRWRAGRRRRLVAWSRRACHWHPGAPNGGGCARRTHRAKQPLGPQIKLSVRSGGRRDLRRPRGTGSRPANLSARAGDGTIRQVATNGSAGRTGHHICPNADIFGDQCVLRPAYLRAGARFAGSEATPSGRNPLPDQHVSVLTGQCRRSVTPSVPTARSPA
jgi:hypothetical protein